MTCWCTRCCRWSRKRWGSSGALGSEHVDGVIDVLAFFGGDAGEGAGQLTGRGFRNDLIAGYGERFEHDLLGEDTPDQIAVLGAGKKTRSRGGPKNGSFYIHFDNLYVERASKRRGEKEAAWPRSLWACSSASAISDGSW